MKKTLLSLSFILIACSESPSQKSRAGSKVSFTQNNQSSSPIDDSAKPPPYISSSPIDSSSSTENSSEIGNSSSAPAQCLYLVNGADVAANEEKSVVFLLGQDAQNQGYMCTGTLVAANIILTAAHCIDASLAQNGGLKYLKGQIFTQEALSMPEQVVNIIDYKVYPNALTKNLLGQGVSVKIGDYDLALLKIEENQEYFSKIIQKKLPTKSPVELLGYGLTSIKLEAKVEYPIKLRKGFNEILYIENQKGLFLDKTNIETTTATGENANIGSGDSGGPLFSQNKKILIGVSSASKIGGLFENDENIGSAYFVDLSLEEVQNWLKKSAQEWESSLQFENGDENSNPCL